MEAKNDNDPGDRYCELNVLSLRIQFKFIMNLAPKN